MALKQTPSQTIGPFFAYGLTAEQYGYPMNQIAGADLLANASEIDGDRIRISGRIFDGAGEVISDAMVEIWQADAQGRYAHPADKRGANSSFNGFGRTGTETDAESRFVFDTIKPGSVDDGQAPHINAAIFARGLLSHVFTRIYFPDEDAANAQDPILAAVPDERRPTLIAKQSSEGRNHYVFDVHLQGANETVFLEASA